MGQWVSQGGRNGDREPSSGETGHVWVHVPEKESQFHPRPRDPGVRAAKPPQTLSLHVLLSLCG